MENKFFPKLTKLRRPLHNRIPTIGRVQPHVDQLELYSRAFGHTTQGPNHARVEILMDVDPDDEIVKISVLIPSILLDDLTPDRPILCLSALKCGQRRAVEIIELEVFDGDVGLIHQRDRSSVEFLLKGDVKGPMLRFEFKAWELVGPTEGISPYIFSELAFVINLPATPSSNAVMTLRTLENVTPRSTQGNYGLAYPSRTFKNQRYLNLYYPHAGEVRLKYRFGTSARLVEPWLAIGRAAVSAAFLFLVTALAGSSGAGERFLAVIAFFVAVATVVWDLAGELSRFTIYGRTKRTIHWAVLGAQILVVVTFLLAIIGLRDSHSVGVLAIASCASGIVATILGITAFVGFYLHFVGRWHGYRCDIEGCDKHIKVRRERPECRYTGRVPCDNHVESICSTCDHCPDLQCSSLTTVDKFDIAHTPCINFGDTIEERGD